MPSPASTPPWGNCQPRPPTCRPRNTSPVSRISTMPTLARKPSESMTSLMSCVGVCHKVYVCGMIRVVKHAALDIGRLKGLTVLLCLAAAVCLASLLSGGSGITGRQAVAPLLGAGDEAARSVMMEVRVPRLLAAFGVGGLLALSGVLLQALFRNPLADPYVLGVSGGAAIGALLAMIAGAAAIGVQSAAVAGAL